MQQDYFFLSRKLKFSRVLLGFFLVCFFLFTKNVYAQGTNCAGATAVTINGACLSGTISNGVEDAPFIGTTCTGTFGKEGWYTFTVSGGPLNITITAEANNRNLFLQLISSTASCTGLSQIGCANANDTSGLQTETISQTLSNGIYYIKVLNVGGSNNMTLNSLCVTSSIPCTAPSNQASGFTPGTITGTAFPASFIGAANGYLVIRSLTSTPPSQPVNGTIYSSTNIATLGSGLTFIQSGSSSSIPSSGLTENTQYYYFIYAYNNSSCAGGPAYNTSGPLTGSAITCPAVPNAVTTASVTSTGFTLNWTAPTGGSAGSVNYSIQVTTDAGYTTNISGSPFLVTGPTATLNISGLSASTTYYYRILASNGCNSPYVTGSVTTLVGNPCSSATTLNCSTTNLAGTTVGSINYTHGNGCSMSNYGKWYTFVGDGNLNTISVTTTGFDAEMAIASGSCGSLTNITCQDSALSNGTETYAFTATLGVTYYVYVAYWLSGDSTTGAFTISRSCTTAFNPCATIPNIAACGTSTSITISSGTGSYGTSACGWTTPGREQIYTFTPTATGSYTISQSNSFAYIDYQFKPVSSGCSGTGWTCIDDIFGSGTSTSFSLTAGTQYYILLDPESTVGGNVSFTINCPPPPLTNDDPCNAITLTTSSNCTYSTYSTLGATATSGVTAPGCASYAGGDVWFKVVVPATGILSIDTNSGGITDGGMAAYSGTCGALTLIECDDDDSTNGLMSYLNLTGLTPGNTIFIRVWEYGNDNPGSFGICITSPTCPPPTDILATVTSSTSVSVSWMASTPPAANGYQYYLTTTNTPPTGSTLPTGSTTAGVVSVNLTGLITSQIYYFWVRSNCSGLDQSTWLGPKVFTPCNIGPGTGTTDLSCPNLISGGLGLLGSDPAAMSCTDTTCVNLEATYSPINQTTSYTVQSITYNPPYQFSCLQNAVSVNVDDIWSPTVNLPFNFCFYGNNYNSCLIGSNGVITFDNTNNSPGGYCAWSFANNLPSNTLFLNSIFGVYHDIDPSKGGEIGWELVNLNNGCRALVASWNNIPMFSSTCNSILYTGMIVLYENTNVIEVYIKEKNVCSTWNSGNAIVGIQNATGAQAVVAPNRNGLSTDWTVSNEAWRFTPSGSSLSSITWYEGLGTTGPVVGNTNTISVCPNVTQIYTAQVTYTLCTGINYSITDNTIVTVNGGKRWNGSIDTDWNKANNWTPTGIPTNTDCVIIPNVTNDPIISGSSYNAYGYNLSILNGGNLLVNSTNNITITDFVNVDANGLFTLNNSSSLIQINNTTNTGNIAYKRDAYVRSLDYVYWSSPVANFSLSNIASPLSFWGMYKWNTTVANSNGGQGNWESAAGDTMIPGKGYIASGPSTFSADTAATLNGIFTGVPNNGNITIPIYRGSDTNTSTHYGTNGAEITNYSDNWNLLGNPYPSSIRASQFLFDNNTKIMGNVKLWTHGTLPAIIASPFYDTFIYNYSPGDYLTYNFTGTSCCPAAGSDLFIGSGQGFFVQMIDGPATSNSITFTNSLRSNTYSNSTFYKLTNPNISNSVVENLERNRIWLDIIDSNNQSDRTLFGYIENATMDYDSFFDCVTQNTGGTAIYSLLDNTKLSIQGRTLPFDLNDEVPIGINIPASGNYTIALAAIDGLFSEQNIYLKDNLLNIIHDLKTNPYQFKAESGINHDRFKVVYLIDALGNAEFSSNNNVRALIKDYVAVSSNNLTMESIIVYNVLGQIIDRYDNVKANYVTLTNLRKNNTTLLLKIKLQTGETVIRKVIY